MRLADRIRTAKRGAELDSAITDLVDEVLGLIGEQLPGSGPQVVDIAEALSRYVFSLHIPTWRP